MTAAKSPRSSLGVAAPLAADGSPLVRAPAPLGVYVHFPWCLQKCPYCDFLSIARERQDLQHREYADVVVAELQRRAEELGPRRLNSVFFGGGTPSLWAPRELGRVLAAIRAAFPTRDSGATAAPEVEVTVECNPTSFDAERGRALIGVGVNRVSIGVQGLDRNRLAFLGRLHDPEGGLQAVRAALEAQVPRVSADLIFGVAGQSPESAAAEVRTVAELGLTHVSAYALTIEPGTQFGALAKKGRLPLLGDDLIADSFLAVHETLGNMGFEHYEISNFARAGAYAEHNLGYWRGDEYLGLGCGAWGTIGSGSARVRYRNTPVPERYLSSAPLWPQAPLLQAGPGELVSAVEDLDAETLLRERILLGLRLRGGVDIDAHAKELGVPAWSKERTRAAEKLVARGRLVRDGSRWLIPSDQWLLADGTISELI